MVDLYTGTVPNLTQSQPEFDENTQGILDYIAGLAPQLNEWVGAYVQDTTSASTTSNTIGTGGKTFTVEAGKGYKVNMTLRASATSGNFMDGVVTSYSGTSLTINFTTFTGSGTFSDWNIFLTISGGATLASNTFTGDQFVPDEAYDASGWNGDLSVPTKNAVRDKFESLPVTTTATSDPTFADNSSNPASTSWVNGFVNTFSVLGSSISTSGAASYDISTAIPSDVKRIILMFFNNSLNGSADLLVQVGNGSFVTTGYVSSSSQISTTASSSNGSNNGFFVKLTSAPATLYARMVIEKVSGNSWLATHIGQYSSLGTVHGGGGIILTGALDRLKITSSNGTDLFDSGIVSYYFEK